MVWAKVVNWGAKVVIFTWNVVILEANVVKNDFNVVKVAFWAHQENKKAFGGAKSYITDCFVYIFYLFHYLLV